MVNQAGKDVRAPHREKHETTDPLVIEFSRSALLDLGTSTFQQDALKTETDLSLVRFKADPISDRFGTGENVVSEFVSDPVWTSSQKNRETDCMNQFVGGLAHDFNNLLMVVSGSLEILQLRISQGRVSETDCHLSAAQDAVLRASAVTRRLVSYSRNLADGSKSLDINRFVADMENMIRHAVGSDVVVSLAVADERWFVVVDPSELESSLLNLCLNARDAMPSGGKMKIENAICVLDDETAHEWGVLPGRYVSLRVSDEGLGMEEQALRRAFEPFFTTKPVGKGTGLGLSMVKSFVDRSDGAVKIASRRNVGTDVVIYLPIHDPKNLEAGSSSLMEAARMTNGRVAP